MNTNNSNGSGRSRYYSQKQFYNDPGYISEGILNHDFIFDPGGESLSGGCYTLLYWRDDFYHWNKGVWKQLSDPEIKRIVGAFIKKCNDNTHDSLQQVMITTKKINDVIANLKSTVGIPEHRELNTWDIEYGTGVSSLSFENGTLLLRKNCPDKPFLAGHSPGFFNLVKLPYQYDPEAVCPGWIEFIYEVTCGRKQYMDLLRQWCAYLFRDDLKEQKFLLCVGEGSNGKGVFSEVVQALVGKENCSQVSLSRFSNPFALYSMLGKTLNVTNESSRNIENETENVLKSLVAGDRFTFERKFKQPVHEHPTAKIQICTNELPKFSDRTNGIWRRILLVPFDKTFTESQQNRNLADELKKELPGIFNWSIAAMNELNQKGFTVPDDAKNQMDDYRKSADPTRAFLLENYTETLGADEYIPCAELYETYRTYCQDNGYRPLGERHFGRQVKRVFKKVERKQKGGKGGRYTVYIGIIKYK